MTNIGIPQLGYKEASGQHDSLLGDEYIVRDETRLADGSLKLNSGRPVKVRWVKNSGATALVPGQPVKRAASGAIEHDVVDVAAVTDRVTGIVDPNLSSNVAQNEKFLIIVEGPVQSIADGAITAGDALSTSADGQVVSNNLSTVALLASAFAVALEGAASAGDAVRIDVVNAV